MKKLISVMLLVTLGYAALGFNIQWSIDNALSTNGRVESTYLTTFITAKSTFGPFELGVSISLFAISYVPEKESIVFTPALCAPCVPYAGVKMEFGPLYAFGRTGIIAPPYLPFVATGLGLGFGNVFVEGGGTIDFLGKGDIWVYMGTLFVDVGVSF